MDTGDVKARNLWRWRVSLRYRYGNTRHQTPPPDGRVHWSNDIAMAGIATALFGWLS